MTKISIVAALSLDGRIGGFRPSSEDRAHLEALRDRSDASVIGAGTLRKENPEMRGTGGKLEKRRIRACISLSGNIPFEGKKMFQEGPTPLIFTRKDIAGSLQKQAGTRAEILGLDLCGTVLDLRQAAEVLNQRGAETILIEGGGGLYFHSLQQGIVQELFLTLCPKFLGKPDAEPFLLADQSLDGMHSWELVDSRAGHFSEIFLHYQIA